MNDPRFRDRPRPPAEPQDGERLQKVLADAGVASRRDVEFAVRAGRFRVNGRRVLELPCLVDPARDLIELDGEVLDLGAGGGRRERERLYLMLNKPKGVISTARDPGGRANVVDLVRAAVPKGDRVYPVGRLDADSTGLVLLTNDGELAHRLAHPGSGIPKEYRVAVQGMLTDAALAQLSKGLFLADTGSPKGGAKRARIQDVRVLKRLRDRARRPLARLRDAPRGAESGDPAAVRARRHQGPQPRARRARRAPARPPAAGPVPDARQRGNPAAPALRAARVNA